MSADDAPKPAATASVAPVGFLRPLDRCVGRAAAVAEIAALLRTNRIVTFTGAPGVGKSRLAMEVVSSLVSEAPPRFSRIVWVDVAEARSGEELQDLVASSLGVGLAAGASPEDRTHAIASATATTRGMLLVLDDIQQIGDGTERLLESLASRDESLSMLLTSRERPAIAGARAYEVEPLSTQSTGAEPSDAAELLRVRAQELPYGLEAGNARLTSLDAIARRLDGLPLALELAAARLAVLTPEELLARLEQRPFEALGNAAASARAGKSLRDVMESAWTALSEDEQSVLAQCAVFRGGFRLESAEAVIALPEGSRRSVLDVFQSLREKSMLRMTQAAFLPGARRFHVLSFIKEFAVQRGATTSRATRERHARHFFAWARDVGSQQKGDRRAIASLRDERENLQAAFVWTIEGLPETSDVVPLAMACAYHARWMTSSYFTDLHPRQLARDVLERNLPLDAWTLAVCCRSHALHLGHEFAWPEALVCATRASEWAASTSDTSLIGAIAVVEGWVALEMGELERAETVLRAAVARLEDTPHVQEVSGLRDMLGWVLSDLGAFDEACAISAKVTATFQRLGNEVDAALAQTLAGNALVCAGRTDEAAAVLRRALATAEREKADWAVGRIANELLMLHVTSGAFDAAGEYVARTEQLVTSDDLVWVVASMLAAIVAVHDGDGRAAERLRARAASRIARRCTPRIAILFEMLDLCIEVLNADAALLAGDRHGASLALEAIRGRLAALEAPEGFGTRSPDGRPIADRFASSSPTRRLLRRLLAEHTARVEAGISRSAIRCHREGQWFELLDGTRVVCKTKSVALIVAALVAKRRAAPGAPLSIAELFEAGWPGERAADKAVRNRVHVTLSWLRANGLKRELVRVDECYALETATEFELADE